jgi:chemotaxis methyl-accepting protein methylase
MDTARAESRLALSLLHTTPSTESITAVAADSQPPLDIFERLRALNARLKGQEQRLVEKSQPRLPQVLTQHRKLADTLRAWQETAPTAGTTAREWHEAGSLRYRDWSHNTAFFRDDAVWHTVANAMLFDAARAAVRRSSALRVWSCGCSSGEELYTTRMVYDLWVRPSLIRALGAAPAFEGVGTDRAASIVATAQDTSREWSAAALSNVPAEFLAARAAYFSEIEESDADRAARLAREVATGEKEGVPRRFTLAERATADCRFGVEDLTGLDAPAFEPHNTELFDLILCRYSIFLYSDGAPDPDRTDPTRDPSLRAAAPLT